MAKNAKFLAFDFGAESGRALLATLSNNKLYLEEIHRFANTPVRTLGSLHWDILRLFHEIKVGLKKALEATDGKIDGVAVDTWGVDFGLFDESGKLLGNPVHYRDERTNGMMEEVFKIIPREDIYKLTGIQSLQFNTLYQLFALASGESTALKSASKLLMIPDIFNYWLSGEMVSEFSIASTSQCYDPLNRDWAKDMLERLGIPSKIMPKVVKPGTKIGYLAKALTDEIGLGEGVPVYAPAGHDTGSAVAAVPASGEGHAFLSSGTWSLMGVEIKEPILSLDAMNKGFTNEGGVEDTYRFLQNIMGLWLVQECRRTWLSQGKEYSYAELTDLAGACDGFVSVVNPNASVFLTPGDMPQRIKDYCKETNQKIPESVGEIVRCALDSLALKYRSTIESLDELLGKKLEPIHIVGGGTQNKLLSQLCADAAGRKVITGPIEATAIGNLLAQAIGAGVISSLSEARKIVRNSFELIIFEPRTCPEADKAYEIFKHLK